MDDIVRISSSAPWEPIFGYSRAVRAGDWVAVSGSTGLDEHGQLVGRGQIYVQARQAISNIAAALGRLGLGLERVVRTRVYVLSSTASVTSRARIKRCSVPRRRPRPWSRSPGWCIPTC